MKNRRRNSKTSVVFETLHRKTGTKMYMLDNYYDGTLKAPATKFRFQSEKLRLGLLNREIRQ